MKNLLKWLWIIGVTLGISGCLEVTPNTETLILENGQTQIFTAESNIMNAEVVWTLDGYEVARGNKYFFMAIGDCAAEKNQTLTVTEQGGSTLIFHETATWTIQIPALSCPPSCYLDEDGDGFGDINKPVVDSYDVPSNCIQDTTDCDDSNPKIHPGALEIIDGFDNNCNGEIDETLLLYVYSNGWGTLLEIIEMEEEGPITVTVKEENPYYGDIPSYFIYAMRSGYFTEYYYCRYGDTIEVDLDPIDPEKFNGTLFITQYYFGPTYLSNTPVAVYQDGQFVTDFKTDDMGRFSIEIPPGNYSARFENEGFNYEALVTVTGNYADFKIPAHSQAKKPNIYIYPEETIDLSVDILFPQNGYVSQSIPDYGSGWHVTVDPSGLIDGQYAYLFYESVQPDLSQYSRGWVVETDALSEFFTANMAQTGFNQREIADFIEYWIPRLTEYPFYAIYPQYKTDLDPMTHLQFSVQPDNLLRLIYTVKGVENNRLNISQPDIPHFSREGFSVVEWGVIIK